MKLCPFCAEEIQDAAIVCKHCGRDIAVIPPVANIAPTVTATQSTGAAVAPTATPAPLVTNAARRGRPGLGLLLVIVGFVMAVASSTAAPLAFIAIWVGIGVGLTGSAIVRWGGGFILAVIITAVGAVMGRTTSTPTSTSPSLGTSVGGTNAPVPAAQPSLALLSSRGYESDGGGYHIIEGQVENLTDKSLKSIVAVGIWMDKDDNFITSDDALIDYNPILPGQTSPFKTMSRTNPAMSKYRVEFKQMFGGTLSVEDKRK